MQIGHWTHKFVEVVVDGMKYNTAASTLRRGDEETHHLIVSDRNYSIKWSEEFTDLQEALVRYEEVVEMYRSGKTAE